MKVFWFFSLFFFALAVVPPYAKDYYDTKTLSERWIPELKESTNTWDYWLFVGAWSGYIMSIVQVVTRWQIVHKQKIITTLFTYSWSGLWTLSVIKIEKDQRSIWFFLSGCLLWNLMNLYHRNQFSHHKFKKSIMFTIIINLANFVTFGLRYCDSCGGTDWLRMNTILQYVFLLSLYWPLWYYAMDDPEDDMDFLDLEPHAVQPVGEMTDFA